MFTAVGLTLRKEGRENKKLLLERNRRRVDQALQARMR
jgi:hypothetical protein